MKDKVAVIGVGCTHFGDNFHQSYEEMVVESAYAAFGDAGIEPDRVDAAWLSTYSPYGGNGKAAVSLAEPLRLYGKPITRVENYCAGGSDAFRNAAAAVAAGLHDVALVLGAEKLKDRPVRGLQNDGGHPYQNSGLTAPGLMAMAATRYLHEFGLGREPLAKVAVKNHHHGTLNPKAHFRMEVTEQKVLDAPIIAWPFGLFDCCPTTDGAAAAVLCRADMAKSFRDDYVLLKGMGMSVQSGRPWNDPHCDYSSFLSTREAAAQAYRMAGITDPVKEIDVAEVHDCFTWTELTHYEDLGFCRRGEAPEMIREGRTRLGGDLPVNTSGGLKSCGHPIGASGVRMVYEIVTQLRGQAQARQVPDAELGLVHNLGGPGAIACVLVLGR
jgi:acetyl-CoA C-acetyltransferase